jgi:hypothetical protein
VKRRPGERFEDSVNGGTEIAFEGNTILLVGVQAISQFDLLI